MSYRDLFGQKQCHCHYCQAQRERAVLIEAVLEASARRDREILRELRSHRAFLVGGRGPELSAPTVPSPSERLVRDIAARVKAEIREDLARYGRVR